MSRVSKVYVFNDYGGPEGQQLIERQAPQPGPGEIAVRVHAAGVNPFDWKLRSGLMATSRSLPAPMGQEVAGTVTAVGEGATKLRAGDEVLGPVLGGYGGWAEDTLLRADRAVTKPAEIPFRDAAALPIAGATAYAGIHQVELENGRSLLINGAGGGVGLMAAQLGRARGLRVVGTGSEGKRAAIEDTGASFVVSGEGVTDRVRELFPDGVDVVFDLVGGEALRAVAPLAKDPSHVISAADGATAEQLGGQSLQRGPGMLDEVVELVRRGLVDPNVLSTYPLEEAGEALARVEDGHTRGKVVIEVIPDPR